MSAETEQQLLLAKIDSVKSIVTLLKAVALRETAVVVATSDGLKVTVEDSKCVQLNAFIQAELFQVFVLASETVTFKINLSVCIDCLTVFSSCSAGADSTALEMRYKGAGHPLVLILEDNGVITDCSVETMIPDDDPVNFSIASHDRLNKAIIRSECMKEAFSDVDVDGDSMSISFSASPAYIEFAVKDTRISSQVRIGGGGEMVEVFECQHDTTALYRHALIKMAARPLSHAHKVSLRVDTNHLLCLQFMVRVDNGSVCFVEFFCVPLQVLND